MGASQKFMESFFFTNGVLEMLVRLIASLTL